MSHLFLSCLDSMAQQTRASIQEGRWDHGFSPGIWAHLRKSVFVGQKFESHVEDGLPPGKIVDSKPRRRIDSPSDWDREHESAPPAADNPLHPRYLVGHCLAKMQKMLEDPASDECSGRSLELESFMALGPVARARWMLGQHALLHANNHEPIEWSLLSGFLAFQKRMSYGVIGVRCPTILLSDTLNVPIRLLDPFTTSSHSAPLPGRCGSDVSIESLIQLVQSQLVSCNAENTASV